MHEKSILTCFFFLEYAKDLRIIALKKRVQIYKRRAYDKRHRRSYGRRPDCLANKSEIRYYIKDNNHEKSGATHY
jgi:hypothetical protein